MPCKKVETSEYVAGAVSISLDNYVKSADTAPAMIIGRNQSNPPHTTVSVTIRSDLLFCKSDGSLHAVTGE